MTLRKVCALFGVAFGVTGCDLVFQKTSSQTVLQVNQSSLSVREFSERLGRILKDYDALTAKDPAQVQRAKDRVVENFVIQVLIETAAQNSRITVSDDEIEEEVQKLRGEYPDDLSFRRILAQENLSLRDWRERVRGNLLERKVLGKITEKVPKPEIDELRQYYQDNKTRYQKKERIYLRQIVVDNLTKAKAISDEIKNKDFATLASKYSVAPEGKDGGVVGWVEKGTVDVFDKAFTLKVGGVSPVLESSYGFHIFKVERRAPPGLASFDEVRKEIELLLRAQKEQALYMAWLDSQIRSTKVQKNSELLQAITVETRSSR